MVFAKRAHLFGWLSDLEVMISNVKWHVSVWRVCSSKPQHKD